MDLNEWSRTRVGIPSDIPKYKVVLPKIAKLVHKLHELYVYNMNKHTHIYIYTINMHDNKP